MPRLGCDTHVEKSEMEIADRIIDLRNRVKWLKNVEYCLEGDQNKKLTNMKTERHNLELMNDNLRKLFNKSSEKTFSSSSEENQMFVDNIECIHYKRNQLIYIQKSLEDRLEFLRDQLTTKSNSSINQPNQNENKSTSHLRQIRDRLSNVKLIQRTLKTCKQHLQCDLDLLEKELPNLEKQIEDKCQEEQTLKKKLSNILNENKRYLKSYQQLVNHTENQNRQRRALHEQAMSSVTEQLENQYQAQITAVNGITTSIESQKLNSGTLSFANIQPNQITPMNNNEILEVRSFYDQFYNIIMAGYPIDINNFDKIEIIPNEFSTKMTAMLTMINRMIDEKEQINQQIDRTDQLLKQIDLSINAKKETQEKIFDTMTEQQKLLEMFYINDTIQDQNRIIRQINDFLVVLANSLCEYIDRQFIDEPSRDFIERLEYISSLVIKTSKTLQIETIDTEDQQTFPAIYRHTLAEENSHISKDSINSNLSIRSKRNSMKKKFY